MILQSSQGRRAFQPPTLDVRNFLGGVNYSVPTEILKPQFASESQGVRLRYHELHAPYGREKLGSSLSGQVQVLDRVLRYSGTPYNVALTTDFLYKWAAGDWAVVREIYSAETVDVAKDSEILTGNNTKWTDFVSSGDPIDLPDGNYAYEVDSVDNDTQITMTTTYGGDDGTGVSYSIKLGLEGSLDVPATYAFGQNTWLFSNGVNWVKKFDGTDLTTLTGASGYQTKDWHKAEIVRYFGDSVVLLNTTEDGNNIFQRVRWSDIGTLATWSPDNFYDLVDTPGKIVNAREMGNELMIYRTDSIVGLRALGSIGGFVPRTVATGVGLSSRKSLIQVGNAHFFLGESWSQGLNLFLNQGGQMVPIGNPIRAEVQRELTREYKHRSWSLWNEEEEVVMFFMPVNGSSVCNRVWIYEVGERGLKKGRWWKDEVSAGGGGIVSRETAVAIEDLVGAIQDQDWTLGWASFGKGGTMVALGQADGDIVELVPMGSTDEDGNPLRQFVESKDFCYADLDAPRGTAVRCQGLEVVSSGHLKVLYSLDHGDSWAEAGTADSLQFERHKFFFNVRAPSVRIRFENLDTADKFELERWFLRLEPAGRLH